MKKGPDRFRMGKNIPNCGNDKTSTRITLSQYIQLMTSGMKAPGATLPRLTSKTKLLKGKPEEHSHAKGPPTGSILFHNFFETDLSVVTHPKLFHKMLRTFTTEAPFFSVARHTPLTVKVRNIL
jgi:hypothetical protein